MSSATIPELLEQILNYTGLDPRLRSNLRKGLSASQIQQKLEEHEFPFCLPGEVEALYQWHDGIQIEASDCELFHYHTFLPLDAALEVWSGWKDFNTEQGDEIYLLHLLPLFEFEGEYYSTECGRDRPESSPIWFVYHDYTQIYNSLKTMLLSILECYTTGAYQPIYQEGRVDTTLDQQRIAEIKYQHNPVRKEMYDYYLSRHDFYYHP